MSTFAEQQLELSKAGLVISEKLGLPAGSVTFTVGDRTQYPNENDAKNTYIILTVQGLGSDLEQQQAKDKILSALDNIPAVRQILQTVSDENMARDVAHKLKIATEGTDFDKHLLNWAVLAKPETLKEANEYANAVNNYAIEEAGNNAYGTEFYIKIPSDKNTDPKEMIEKVDNNIKERLPEIQASLTEGVVKYITKNLQHEGKSETKITEELEKAKADMAKLKIAVNIGNGNNLSVTIRSPKQEEAVKARTGSSWEVPSNADELKASNPLNELSSVVKEHEKQENPDASPQFNKALSRAFLYGGGEKAMEVFPLIAGRRDIYNAINKEAKRFPEKTELFQEILASDLFKKHGWGIEKDEAGAAPAKPLFRKDHTKPDTLELLIETPENKVHETISALAGMAGQGQNVANIPPKASAIAPENFRKNSETNWLADIFNRVLPASKADVLAVQRGEPIRTISI